MIKSGVIGWPIAHSRSPLIHGYWLKQHQIDGAYDKTAVEPSDLSNFINSLHEGERVGANVTLPHKEAAIAYVDEPDDRVRRIGVLNTIWREGGKLHATSTDGPGFLASLREVLNDAQILDGPITILGAGGSVPAIVDELLRAGADHITIWNRTTARAEKIAARFGVKVSVATSQQLTGIFAETKVLVNTTSAGLKGEGELAVPWGRLSPNAAVADIVYTPLITTFLQTAQSRGHPIVPGLGMLLHQAVVGFEKWFGMKPVVSPELHDLVARDIDPDFKP